MAAWVPLLLGALAYPVVSAATNYAYQWATGELERRRAANRAASELIGQVTSGGQGLALPTNSRATLASASMQPLMRGLGQLPAGWQTPRGFNGAQLLFNSAIGPQLPPMFPVGGFPAMQFRPPMGGWNYQPMPYGGAWPVGMGWY